MNLPIVLFASSGKLVRQLGRQPQEGQPDQRRQQPAFGCCRNSGKPGRWSRSRPSRRRRRTCPADRRLQRRQLRRLNHSAIAPRHRRGRGPAQFGLALLARELEIAGLVIGDLGAVADLDAPVERAQRQIHSRRVVVSLRYWRDCQRTVDALTRLGQVSQTLTRSQPSSVSTSHRKPWAGLNIRYSIHCDGSSGSGSAHFIRPIRL